MDDSRWIHPDDVLRLKTIREQIEELERNEIEKTSAIYDKKVCEIQRNVTGVKSKFAMEARRRSEEDLEPFKRELRRLSDDLETSKSFSDSVKGDIVSLYRLRKDEQQLLQAIFSNPGWSDNATMKSFLEDQKSLERETLHLQMRMGAMNEARGLLDVGSRKVEQVSLLIQQTDLFGEHGLGGNGLSMKDMECLKKADEILREAAHYVERAQNLVPAIPKPEDNVINNVKHGVFAILFTPGKTENAALCEKCRNTVNTTKEQILSSSAWIHRAIKSIQAEKAGIESARSKKRQEMVAFQRSCVLRAA